MCLPKQGGAAWRELGLIYFAIITDGMASSIMVSYVAKWIQDDFLILDNVGLYGGLLIGIINFAGAISSPFLGWCSDVRGRRIYFSYLYTYDYLSFKPIESAIHGRCSSMFP